MKAGTAVRKGAEDAVALLEQKPIALEILGRARGFVEVMKNFSDFVAEVSCPCFSCVIGLNEVVQIHPAAKAAVIAFDMLYEVI